MHTYLYIYEYYSPPGNADLVVTPVLTTQNDPDPPRQWEQPSQEPVHVHFFFHGSLLAAHHCFLHPAMIAKEV